MEALLLGYTIQQLLEQEVYMAITLVEIIQVSIELLSRAEKAEAKVRELEAKVKEHELTNKNPK